MLWGKDFYMVVEKSLMSLMWKEIKLIIIIYLSI